MGAKPSAPGWPDEIHRIFSAAGVRQVGYVPDAGHARLIKLCAADRSMKTVVLTTEEEGVAMLAGAWLGGERGALLMQFYPGRVLLDDPTNAWAPTGACLAAMVEEAVFDVWHCEVHGTRCVVAATRSEDPDRMRWRESDSGLLR